MPLVFTWPALRPESCLARIVTELLCESMTLTVMRSGPKSSGSRKRPYRPQPSPWMVQVCTWQGLPKVLFPARPGREMTMHSSASMIRTAPRSGLSNSALHSWMMPKASVGSSGVYVVGVTGGELPGQTSSGLNDVFVRQYHFNGTEGWTHQFGTNSHDVAFGVSA